MGWRRRSHAYIGQSIGGGRHRPRRFAELGQRSNPATALALKRLFLDTNFFVKIDLLGQQQGFRAACRAAAPFQADVAVGLSAIGIAGSGTNNFHVAVAGGRLPWAGRSHFGRKRTSALMPLLGDLGPGDMADFG